MTTTSATPSVYSRASYGGTAPENYQRYFVPAIGGPLASDFVARAGLHSKDRVLDVATGTGVVARLAAGRVGAAGSVAALDVNPGMLGVARSLPSGPGAEIRWYETGAESIPLPDDAFDAVLCHLGLQFMQDKAAAAREMCRVLRPGGRLLVSTPSPVPFFDVLDRALAHHVGDEAAMFVKMVFSLHDPAEIRGLLQAAGFHDARVETRQKTLRLPPAADFLWQYVHCTPLTGTISQLAEEQIRAIEHEVIQGWAPWSDHDGMTYDQRVVVAAAEK